MKADRPEVDAALNRLLRAGEAAFLDRGEIDPGGLDVAPEIQARIAAMPKLAWKRQNVRAHRGKPG